MPVRHVVRPGRRWGGAGFRLGMGVAAWWMLAGGAVALLLPASVVVVPKDASRLAVGEAAHVDISGMVKAANWFPIPVERTAFDLAQRGYREDNERLLDDALLMGEWITVMHRQPIRVATSDGEIVQVELLDGPDAGRLGWLKGSQLAP